MRISITGALWAIMAVMASGSALAAPKYGRAGCGLGSIIMGPSGNQTSAWTSNNWLGYNQIFGISSGTSNCQVDTESAAEHEQEKFITANLTSISKEMAEGRGDTLDAFAEVLGCPAQSLPAFSAALKSGYHQIFLAPGALAVLDASKAHLKTYPALAQQCSWLS